MERHIVNLIMQILVDFITLQRDIHVYMKLFRLYIFPMFDIVIQRCGLIS